jgi:rhamnose utilization protein RhaD (predicted bifunctional aldolase and dehydrogenase)
MKREEVLETLVWLSRELGVEDRNLVILGEGNTSADNGDGTFWVKASGYELSNIEKQGFSLIDIDAALAYLEGPPLDDQAVSKALKASQVDPSHAKPSVETFLHALCIKECGAKFIAHSHAVSVNQILCSTLGAKPFMGNICPDQIVVCGSAPAVVPYIDPGFHLAVAVRDELRRYMDVYGNPPKVLFMVNHGVVSLGKTAREALNIQLMTDKWAKILVGALSVGDIRYMDEVDVLRISSRLDEKYRQALLEK